MYYEEFEEGKKTITPSRQVKAEELDAFLDITGLHLPMFLDDESAQEIGHPRRLVTGPMILAVAMGLVKASGWFDQVVAVTEFTGMRFLKAVHPGDTLQAAINVRETRPTRDARRGLVVLDYSINNQHGDVVLQMQGTYLFRTRTPS
jgi:2-methylfumaryl-CoA hydratase